MSDNLEARLRQVLRDHRYESLMGGTRGLMDHHIDALVDTLLPFIQSELVVWSDEHDHS